MQSTQHLSAASIHTANAAREESFILADPYCSQRVHVSTQPMPVHVVLASLSISRVNREVPPSLQTDVAQAKIIVRISVLCLSHPIPACIK